ncbi:isoaspartyl peptidase/L-asparaginase [Citrobacter sp. NCU1]|uniref:isoaspartyl peptidase/L-asparaginase n=1 Tax=Citrobacter sp. NCU1 TaxID=2026683 RepID=UPI001391D656|nr:isoaspartyl peptidase/L-asparaginase [Citrobacter sp. NCU1]
MENLKNSLATLTLCPFLSSPACADSQAPIQLDIHGGAGAITKETITPEQEKHDNETLTEALNAGYAVLKIGRACLKGFVALAQGTQLLLTRLC